MKFKIFSFIICCSYLQTITANSLVKIQGLIDLTWPFKENETIYWPNNQPFIFTKKYAGVRNNGIWYSANEFQAAEHGGTHLDAPYHFNKQGWKVGDLPLERLIAQGLMIDLADEVKELKDQARLLPEHLEAWVKNHGTIPDNSVILINFGWSKYYGNKSEYLGIDDKGNLNFPGISKAAAEWIVASNKVVGVGVDTASVDPGATTNYSAHRILSAAQIHALENVKIPPIFSENGFELYVMPMKIAEGTGAPLRLIAAPLGTDVLAHNLGVPISAFRSSVSLLLVSTLHFIFNY